MKKKNHFYQFIAISILPCITFFSCNMQNFFSISKTETENYSNYLIVNKVNDFKQKGMLDFLYNTNARVAITDDELNYDELRYFVENTEECVSEILKEDNGEKSLAVLNAIYGEQTVGDIYNAMSDLSSELANEYESTLVNIYNEKISDNSRCINNISNLKDLKIDFDFTDTARTIDFSESFTWGYVTGYVASSAATIAGLLMWRFGKLWTKVAGLVAAGIGVTSMSTIIVMWQSSTDWKTFQNFCIALYKSTNECYEIYQNCKDEEKAKQFLEILSTKLENYIKQNPESAHQLNKILSYIDENYVNFSNITDTIKSCLEYYNNNTSFFGKVVTVTVATTAVAGVAWGTGFVSLVKGWISSLSNLIPEWLIITGNGFSLKFLL